MHQYSCRKQTYAYRGINVDQKYSTFDLLLPLQQFRQYVQQDKNAVNPTKSARKNGGDNKQRQGNPHVPIDTNTSQYWYITSERIPDQIISIDLWKSSVRGSKPQKRRAQTPHNNDYGRRIYDTDRLQVCATAQTRWLPTSFGDSTIASTRNRTVLTKPSTIQKIYCHGRSTKELYRRGSTTSLPVSTSGPVDGFWTEFHTLNDTSSIYRLQGYRQNQPQGKCSKNDGVIWPCGNPIRFNRKIIKGERNHACRRAYNCQRNDGVQKDQHFVTDIHIQEMNLRVETEN